MKKLYPVLFWFLILGLIFNTGCTPVFAQARLILDGAIITIAQGAYLVIENPAANAITRNSGYIVSEGENNMIKWMIGTTTGNYTVPWGYNSNYIPLSFTPGSGTGGSGYFLFSTYHTGWQNSTQLPTGVANMNGASGTDNSAFASDRFWQVNAQSYTVKPTLSNLTFTYIDVENSATNNTITESNLKASRYHSSLTSWTDVILASTLNTTSNAITVTSVNAANLQPWWVAGTLGANRYWVAPSNSTSNVSANWAETTGGAGNAGVPTLVDVVIFDGNSTANSTIDANLTAANLLVNAGYTGIITQGASTITLSNTVTFSGGTFVGGSADIGVGGMFTLSGTAFTSTAASLILKKDLIVNSGSFAHNAGTVNFSGTDGVTQNISGPVTNTFNNITVSNTANPGVSIESNQNLTGVLTLGSNVIFDADGSNSSIFKLTSTSDSPTQDAGIAILPSGAQVTGNVTVQRFMTKEGANNNRIYRYISSAVQNAPVSDIQNEIPVTGSFTGTSTCSGCLANQSLFSYAESVITDTNGSGAADFDDGYIDFPNASNAETLVPGRGYALFARGDLLSSTLWDVRGPVNTGNVTPVSLPVTYTSSGNILNDGWNLVGNPFPSTIDWNAVSGWTKTNIDASIYVSDNGNASLQYATWNGVTGTNGGSRYIAIGQGFWTKANGSGVPVLQANENIKTAGTQTTFFREGSPENLLRVTMSKELMRDEAVIHFREDATPGFDTHADALKLPNASFNISSVQDGRKLSINSTYPMGCATEISLNIENSVAGNYQLTFSEYESFSDHLAIRLEDHFTMSHVDARNSSGYNFSITSIPESYASGRFKLIFTIPAAQISLRGESLVSNFASGNQWYFNHTVIPGATQQFIIPDQPGTYSVKVSEIGCTTSADYEYVVTGLENPASEIIHVFPNPVRNEIMVRIPEAFKDIEGIRIINNLGQVIGNIELQRINEMKTGHYDMTMHPAGLYILQSTGTGKVIQVKVIKH